MIGKMVKQRRLELGLTQDELAKRMGYKSKSTIAKIESDVNDVSQSRVVQLANALGVDVAYLIFGSDNTEKSKREETEQRWHRLLTYYEALSQGDKEMIENLMRKLAHED